jgi:hypothetical protein
VFTFELPVLSSCHFAMRNCILMLSLRLSLSRSHISIIIIARPSSELPHGKVRGAGASVELNCEVVKWSRDTDRFMERMYGTDCQCEAVTSS